ncbi:MAG: hypothetical protein ACREE0_03470 [Phenylobacterium sp.]
MRRSVLTATTFIGLAISLPQAASARAFGGEAAVHAFLRERLHGPDANGAKVASGFADLNGDGRVDALAYVSGPALCGRGGCSLYVLENTGRGYRLVTRTTITRPPIRVLTHRSHGWRDLGVLVAGGGIIPGYEAVLRFDGKRYPGNPTMQPKPEVRSAGKTVIADAAPSTPL